MAAWWRSLPPLPAARRRRPRWLADGVLGSPPPWSSHVAGGAEEVAVELVHDGGAAEFIHQATFNDSAGLGLRISSLVRNNADSAYREQKLAGITAIATHLGLSTTHAEEALRMAKYATDGELATPGSAFLPTLAAACSLLVEHSHRVPLSLVEAAFCSAPTLADLVSRIATRLVLPPLPCFDYAAALDRTVRLSPSLTTASPRPASSSATPPSGASVEPHASAGAPLPDALGGAGAPPPGARGGSAAWERAESGRDMTGGTMPRVL